MRSSVARGLGQLGQSTPEAVAALVKALDHAEADVRNAAAESLRQLGQSTPGVLAKLLIALNESEESSIRYNAARLLSQIGRADKATLDALWQGLLDSDDDVRTACAQALAHLGRNSPTAQRQRLEARLVRAIQSPQFAKGDDSGRPAYDYVYDALWLLVVGEEVEEA